MRRWARPVQRIALEDVRHDALGSEGVPHAEGETHDAEDGRHTVERAPQRPATERRAPAGREDSHRHCREEGEQRERYDCGRVVVDRREQEDADASASAHAVAKHSLYER